MRDIAFHTARAQGNSKQKSPILRGKDPGVTVGFRSRCVGSLCPRIYNCGVVLTRLYVTKVRFFNKEEVFSATHVECDIDFLITHNTSGAIFLQLLILSLKYSVSEELSDALSYRVPILGKFRIDSLGLLDQLIIQLLMGFNGEPIVMLLGQGQACFAHLHCRVFVP